MCLQAAFQINDCKKMIILIGIWTPSVYSAA